MPILRRVCHTILTPLQIGRAAAAGLVVVASFSAPPAQCETAVQPVTPPWGISASASSMKDYPEWFPKMRTAGVQAVRLFPEWRGLERTEGTWDWTRTDLLVKTAGENELSISGLLFGSAAWSKDRSHAFPMNHLEAWSNYTATLVDRYKGRVRDWEVWNEGNAAFNDGHHTTADYASLVASAYDAAKKVNPNCRIGMSVASFDAAYLDQAILAQAAAGKADHFDFLCVHPYELLEGIAGADGEIPYLWMTRLMRDLLKVDAPARQNSEIWITEVGMPVNKKATETDAAKAVVKAYVMAIAQGISRVMWFEARDPAGEEAGFGLLKRNGSARDSYTTFKTMTTLLGKTPRYVGWLALGTDGRGYGFVFDGPQSPVLVGWMPAGTSDRTVTFSSDVSVLHAVTAEASPLKTGQPLELTDLPAFVTGLPGDRVTEAKANAGRNFPWGGDYSAAKSVGTQFGAQPGNRGVARAGRHTDTPYSFPDGSSGIQMQDDTAVPLYVHPSFASLKTREYYIRMTLRRIGAGNVGMNFDYEIADTKGQGGPMRHSGGWFSLPPDTGWQTHTWHITDACFAKMWGFDFSLRPEKSVPFVIGKVEVSTEPFSK